MMAQELCYLLLVLVCFACKDHVSSEIDEDNPLYGLSIFKENYPRSFFFRPGPERTYEPFEDWEKEFNRLNGIEGKVLDEEIMGISNPNISYFTRFKKRNTNQLVLLHYNGNAGHPMDDTENFFSGHWLYFTGSTIVSDISDDEVVTELKVDDASAFKTNIGRYDDQNEDIGICELDDSGKPNWDKSEQVKLISINHNKNTITVKRGMYGTRPLNFKGGKAYAASHVTEGPWGPDKQLLWTYNFTLNSPKDSNGKSCSDILAEKLAGYFSSNGQLAAFDGIQLDVMRNVLNPLYGGWGELKEGDRFPDSNADGLPDEGIFEGKNLYGLGVVGFLQKLRDNIGDNKLILSDGERLISQRAVGILNGIESEGWPLGSDYNIDHWSDGINRLIFCKENSQQPNMTYINHRWWDLEGKDLYTPFSRQRIVIAASCLTGTIHSICVAPPKENEQVTIWDELKMGSENKIGWLGKPIGPAVRLAEKQKNVFDYKNSDLIEVLREVNKDKIVTLQKNVIKIDQINKDNNLHINIPVIHSSGEIKDALILINLKSDPVDGYPENWFRIARLEIKQHNSDNKAKSGYINKNFLESAYYFTFLNSWNFKDTLMAKMSVENNEPIYIEDIRVYFYPDITYRKFENGLVIANPSENSFEISMNKLFPGERYRRIHGTKNQDPNFNNGERIGEILVLNKKDAIFLVKE